MINIVGQGLLSETSYPNSKIYIDYRLSQIILMLPYFRYLSLFCEKIFHRRVFPYQNVFDSR